MIAVTPLDLAATELLEGHVRRCVFWEADAEPGSVTDPEFEKEAWISHVLLEWGACGQIAHSDDRTVGIALYAPPRMVAGAGRFPTAPASADAVLLTALHETGHRADMPVRTRLIDAVVADLRSRGIRALEAFGRNDDGESGTHSCVADGSCGEIDCMTSTSFFLAQGFTVVASDPEYPRLRLEIQADHLWKAGVERALDQLFTLKEIPTRLLGSMAGASAGLSPGGAARSR